LWNKYKFEQLKEFCYLCYSNNILKFPNDLETVHMCECSDLYSHR